MDTACLVTLLCTITYVNLRRMRQSSSSCSCSSSCSSSSSSSSSAFDKPCMKCSGRVMTKTGQPGEGSLPFPTVWRPDLCCSARFPHALSRGVGRFGERDLGSGLMFHMDTELFLQRQHEAVKALQYALSSTRSCASLQMRVDKTQVTVSVLPSAHLRSSHSSTPSRSPSENRLAGSLGLYSHRLIKSNALLQKSI